MSWQLASFLVLGLVLAAGFGWYERSHPSARVLALVAALAALAIVGRLAFAAIPNVKPTTDVVLLSGMALGAVPGFAVGAVTALVSNFFFAQGPWTPWQMAAWGGVGAAGGGLAWALRGRELGRVPLALVCGLAGFAFGAVMDVYQWTYAAEQTLGSYLVIAGTSLPYNVAHAVGNVVFCLLLGPAFVRAVARYRRRFEIRWRLPSPAVASALALALVLAAAPAAGAATNTERALRYLDRAQNTDGGFGGARGQSSTDLHTGWTALGLAAAGRNPRDVERGGRSTIDFIRRRARSLEDTGDLERTILVLRSAGLSPRSFAGRDLVRLLLRRRDRDGSWGGLVNHTAFGVLALRAAGESPRSARIRAAAAWLEDAQHDDGGFGFAPGGSSDVDDTGAVLQALAAAGRGRDAPARRAVSYLRGAQNADGGFGQMPGRESNAQSTAWAVQGLVAARRDPARLRRGSRTPLTYLRSLQVADGSFRYSRRSAQTPVWVTAQVLTAIERAPFPLGPVPRRRRRASSAAAAPSAVAPSYGRSTKGDENGERGRRSRRRKAPVRSRSELPPDVQSPAPRAGAAVPDLGPGRGSSDDGPSTGLVAGVLGAAAALLLLGRRWWRRRPGSVTGA